jgi:hypothetical protein
VTNIDTAPGLAAAIPATDDESHGWRHRALLIQPSNAGRFSRNVFGVVPEAKVNLTYEFNQHVRLGVGYTFLYWHDVLRPGDAIDPTIDLGNPPETRPQFTFNRGSYWVQGLNLGLEWKF